MFDFPKAPEAVKDSLIAANLSTDGLVLDFFSGSATTAHAVMQLNAEDGGKRKFIMVQLPEITDEKSEAHKAGYKNICEIGKERIRRAGQKIKTEIESGNKQFELGEEPKKVPDIGFRVLKLDSSNMKDVYYTPDEFFTMAQKQQNLFGFTDNIKADRSGEDLLFQVMLDLGILLSAKITQESKLWCVNDNYLIACFDRVDTDLITEIAKKKPCYAVFRDSSFANDSAMINFEQVFNTYSPNTIRRVLWMGKQNENLIMYEGWYSNDYQTENLSWYFSHRLRADIYEERKLMSVEEQLKISNEIGKLYMEKIMEIKMAAQC